MNELNDIDDALIGLDDAAMVSDYAEACWLQDYTTAIREGKSIKEATQYANGRVVDEDEEDDDPLLDEDDCCPECGDPDCYYLECLDDDDDDSSVASDAVNEAVDAYWGDEDDQC